MKVTGGKWKPIILFRLSKGINRFGILSRSIEGISKNMLTQQLRQMELYKIINRKIYAEIPPRVEYSLTT
jgi:DNA-binding HxlR family transcriptional regulator